MKVLLAVVFSGYVSRTGAGFTGTAPLEQEDGRIRSCSVVQGQVAYCSGPWTGDVVLPRGVDHKYVLCKAQSGYVVRCLATGFTGETPLPASR